MRRLTRLPLVVAASLALMAAFTGPATRAAADAACPVPVNGTLTLDQITPGLNAVECGLGGAEIVVSGGTIVVPDPGQRLQMAQIMESGVSQTSVRVDDTGRLEVVDAVEPEATTHADGGPTVIPKCGYSRSYKRAGHYWPKGQKWYLNHEDRPKYLSAMQFYCAARAASWTLEKGVAPCVGFKSDAVSLQHTYGGTTKTDPTSPSQEGARTAARSGTTARA